MKKQIVLAGSLLLAAAFVGTQALSVGADYTDGDGETHYGWSLVCNASEESLWEFGTDGNVCASYAAEGDIGNQRVNMYALRDIEREADEAYSVSATFTPDADTDLSVERAYGLVAWYVDSDNYLIYWVQQKMGGDWSGQFYGRVNGAFKAYVNNSGTTGWNSGEYNDMWWDGGLANPVIRGTRNAIAEKTITLRVVSELDTKEVGGTEYKCRKFELHQIVEGEGGAAEDFVADTYWCRDITAGSPAARVGIYSEAFSFTLSNVAFTGENDEAIAQTVETKIDALGTVSSKNDIAAVEAARVEYEGLLELQSYLAQGTENKLVAAEKAVGAYVDVQINALDPASATFKNDVDSVYDLYMSLSDRLAAEVTELDLLKDMVEQSQRPAVPSVSGVEVSVSKTGATVGETVTCTATVTPSSAEPASYVWYVNGEAVDGANGATYALAPTAAGNYKVKCVVDGVESAEKTVTYTAATDGEDNKDNENDGKKGCGSSVVGTVAVVVGASAVAAAAFALVRKKKEN